MKKPTRRIILYSVLGLLIIFFGGRAFVFFKIKQAIVGKVEKLKSSGVLITYSSFETNFLNSSLSLKEVEIKSSQADSVCSSGGTIKEFSVKGISILPFLLRKKLMVSSVILKHPFILYASHQKINSLESNDGDNSALREIQIDLIRIDSGRMEMVDSSSCAVTLTAKLNFQVDKFSVKNFSTDSVKWKVQDIIAKAITIDLPTRFYHMTLRQLSYYRSDKLIQLDSLMLLPTLGRAEFARKSKQQVDQFTLMMPSLVVNDFEMSETLKPSFIAREVGLQFNLEVFRDKRYARARKKPKILPVAFLHKLNFPLRIDSLRIRPSNIVYEEHPEKGDNVGKVSFNDLNAGIYNISNDSTGESVMKVYSRFMKAGDLNVNFTFPLEKHKLYTVKGSLVNFPMVELNKMLEPVAKIKVETGHIQAMKFGFHYDSKESNGELELRYTDLKVLAIRNDDDKSTNKIVTLIIGAFVKKKIVRSDPKDSRTGTIKFERDSQKAILNYWWKSVLSGVKSVFGFENSSAGDEKKKKDKK